jgi:hypothetical protein
MRERIALCRRLAASTTDRKVAVELRKIADQGEADLARLEAERQKSTKDIPRPVPPAAT